MLRREGKYSAQTYENHMKKYRRKVSLKSELPSTWNRSREKG